MPQDCIGIGFLIGRGFGGVSGQGRQRENRSWLHSGLVVAGLLLLSLTFFIGAIGLFAYQAHAQVAAIHFTQEAAQHVYGDGDRDWLSQHSTPQALARSDGVEEAVVNFATERATVRFRPSEVSVEDLVAAVTTIGTKLTKHPMFA